MGRRSRELKQRAVERERDRLRAERLQQAARRRGCLFCRRRDGTFNSVEHPVPESLGNSEAVLPPGVVCTRCNNGTLAGLDQALCEFMPIAARRTMLGVPSKAGKVPTARFSQGTVDYVAGEEGGNPTLILKANTPGGLVRETERFPDGRVSFDLRMEGGRRMTARYASELSRALLKTGMECAWIDQGSRMFGSKYDSIRSAVMGDPREGFFAAVTKGNPDSTDIRVSYQLRTEDTDDCRMLVVANYLGVQVATDSHLPRPAEKMSFVNVFTFPKSS